MKASVVDLRYKMNDVLKALERNEDVSVMYRGKLKGVIVPASGGGGKRVKDHPFFGMFASGGEQDVLEELAELRKPRHAL